MTTMDERTKIAELLERTQLCVGVGSGLRGDGTVDACSLSAINLALYGRLTDTVPECMSLVIGKWIIRIQDLMPADIRNSAAWKTALVDATGTGRAHEKERLDLVMSWMWNVLTALTPSISANAQPAWATMCEQKTSSAAYAATATAATATATAAYAAYAATAATTAADAADAAAYAAYAADAAAAYAADAADAVSVVTWASIDPTGLLVALNAVSS
jgi:hypothetical protein